MKGWVGLDDDTQGALITKEGNKKVKPEYFKGLNFPEVIYETSPVEIEIGKSVITSQNAIELNATVIGMIESVANMENGK